MVKKNKTSKVFCFMLLFMLIVSSGAIVKAKVYPGNCKNKLFHFDCSTSEGCTEFSEKYNDTSVYVKNSEKSTTDVWCHVISKQNTRVFRLSEDVTVRRGEHKYISNWVFERGLRRAAVCVWAGSPKSSCYIEILWSPDSV